MSAACLLALAACSVDVYKAPPWVDSLSSRLRCGSSPEEVQKLTRVRLDDAPSPGFGRYPGTHVLRQGITDLWLEFEAGHLRSYTMVRSGPLDDTIMEHPSPRHDLCSSKSSFRLTIVVPNEALGSTLVLDGATIARLEEVGSFPLELPAGQHRLSIVHDGSPLFSRTFNILPEGPRDLAWDPLHPELYR
jgi:hypothetical protein